MGEEEEEREAEEVEEEKGESWEQRYSQVESSGLDGDSEQDSTVE